MNHAAATICVAGFFELVPLPPDDQKIFQPWTEQPIDYDKVKERAGRIIGLFSDNDRWVPLINERMFRQRLGAETRVFHERGHFSGSEGTRHIPEVLEALAPFL